ncbi:hypothetical protein CRE_24648 [Caenorhabditis remanei]|uniref:Protein SPT2 homolog n=1 Tax=Caenorhabditis remanei TaxID=31234 RepID=E3N3V5_CAERE|nr:hypothetical protein CRE_24648 [Caenorhabditis remanei]
MNAASKNAKKASREVDRIRGEVDSEKNEARRQLEAEKRARLEMQRRKQEKEQELARKRKEREEEERRKNFTIPKRDGGPSSSSSSVNTDAVRAVLERQRAEKEAKEKKAEVEKQRLMMLRMQANGGKATKKMGKQFGLDVIDLQTRFGGNNEHLETLQKRKWKEEEEADVEADRYRSGVYKALAAKQKNEGSLRATVQGPHRVSTSKSNSLAGLCSRHERTRDTFSPPKDGKKAPERREPVVEKKKIQAAAPIDFKSLMAAASSISEGKPVNLDHLKAKPAKSVQQQQKPSSSSSNNHQKNSLSTSDREKLREKERIKEKQERERENEKLRLKEKERERARAAAVAATSSQKSSSSKMSSNQASGASSSNGHPVPPKKEVRKPFTKGPTPPPLIPAAVPGKKYLPGDVRYKEQQKLIKAIAAAPGSSKSAPPSNGQNSKDRIQAVREAEYQREKERAKQKALKRARSEKDAKEFERNKKIQRRSDNPGPSSSSSYPTSSSSSKNSDKRSYEARRMAELREQQMREKERKKKKMMEKERGSRGGGGSFYKGGDDYSDEDDEDEDEYDDGDDFSDMDDFIDDTDMDMDDMNRKDFEDTLRMVNRKYDTDKWSRREKMISERDMHSDFRRIQTEENFSKRAGFMEDLQEASKGRSVRL